MTAPQRQIIRMDEDGVDDVVISGDVTRIERMSDIEYWVAAYRGDKQVMFSIFWDRKRKMLRCTCYQDDLNCVDDTKDLR